jgi:hypothetical protein
VHAGVADRDPAVAARARHARQRRLGAAPQIRRGRRVGRALHVVGRAAHQHVPAERPRARAELDHVVGGGDHVEVVLDHQHGVAAVAQPRERREQARGVARVQAGGRLVEHVEHAAQTRTEVRGEPNAFGLAARQAAALAVQAQVAETQVEDHLQPRAHRAHDRLRDRCARLRPAQRIAPGEQRVQLSGAELGDGLTRDPHRQRARVQARAAAVLAHVAAHERQQLLFEPVEVFIVVRARLELAAPALEPRQHPFVALPALEDALAGARGQLREGQVGVDFDGREQGLEHPRVVAPLGRSPRGDRTAAQAALRIGHDQRGIETAAFTQPRARLACASRAVERERCQGQLRQRQAAAHAARAGGQLERLATFDRHAQRVAAFAQRELDRIGQARAHARLDHQAIDVHVERVLASARQRARRTELDHLAVEHDPREAVTAQPLEQRREIGIPFTAAAGPQQRRLDAHARALGQREHAVDHGRDAERLDPLAAVRAVLLAGAREQQPEQIVDLGDRADRRTRTAAELTGLHADRR